MLATIDHVCAIVAIKAKILAGETYIAQRDSMQSKELLDLAWSISCCCRDNLTPALAQLRTGAPRMRSKTAHVRTPRAFYHVDLDINI